MLDRLILNTAELNSGTPLSEAITAADFDDLEFNGYSLQDTAHISSIIEAFSAPTRELVTYKAPRTDGGGWNGDYFRERRIKVSGIIEKSTSALLETELDTFKRYMAQSEGNLDLKVNSEIRRIVATLENPQDMFSRREGFHISFTPFDLTFLALEPMWHALEYTSNTFEDIALLSYPTEVEVTGSYKAQPVVIIILQTASSVTKINFKNDTNDDEVEISATYVAGDVLMIDSENKSITINGTEVDYDGIFPELNIGTNELTITVTGSSVQYTATVKYRDTYL